MAKKEKQDMLKLFKKFLIENKLELLFYTEAGYPDDETVLEILVYGNSPIDRLIVWEETPQDYDFWDNINHQWYKFTANEEKKGTKFDDFLAEVREYTATKREEAPW